MHYCTNCGAAVEGNFCAECGTKVKKTSYAQEANNKLPLQSQQYQPQPYQTPLLKENLPPIDRYNKPSNPFYQQPSPPYQQQASAYSNPQSPNFQQQVPPQVIINNVNTNSNINNLSQTYDENESRKSKWLAFLLCAVLGGFGIHRFYVGRIGTGILWALTFGMFGWGYIIDLIMLICGKFRDSDGLELKH